MAQESRSLKLAGFLEKGPMSVGCFCRILTVEFVFRDRIESTDFKNRFKVEENRYQYGMCFI